MVKELRLEIFIPTADNLMERIHKNLNIDLYIFQNGHHNALIAQQTSFAYPIRNVTDAKELQAHMNNVAFTHQLQFAMLIPQYRASKIQEIGNWRNVCNVGKRVC